MRLRLALIDGWRKTASIALSRLAWPFQSTLGAQASHHLWWSGHASLWLVIFLKHGQARDAQKPLPSVANLWLQRGLAHPPFSPPAQACLSTKAKPGTKAALRVRVSEEGEPLLVCVLREGGTESVGLDLIFDQ